jgi:uncharacterized protein YjiS (DUF1127 family)
MAHAIDVHAFTIHSEGVGLLATVRRTFADRRAYLTTYKALSALSDQRLADIGLSRPHLRELVHDAVYAAHGRLPQRPALA